MKHDHCKCEQHIITEFQILSECLIHEYNHPRTKVKVKLYTNEMDDKEKVCNLGIQNWLDIKDENYNID